MAAGPDDVAYGPPPGTHASFSGFSEDAAVERPAIELFVELGWRPVDLRDEAFGADGSPWRGSRRDVLLTKPLRAALERLNPALPPEAIVLALDALVRDRAAMVPAAANREILGLLHDGVEVEFRDPDGSMVKDRARIVDWRNPEANDFLLAAQMWIAGELHTRRTDLIGFVNGVPLLVVELKAPYRPVEDAYFDNIRDYRDTIPALFWPVGFVLLSNGLDARIGASADVPWDSFKEWKRIDDEAGPGRVSLETAIRAAAAPARLLDLVENFTFFEATPELDFGLVRRRCRGRKPRRAAS